MVAIERMIKSMDKKTKEVLIEARIIKIALNKSLNAGIDWQGLFNVGSQLGTTYLGSTPSAFTAVHLAVDVAGEFSSIAGRQYRRLSFQR